MRKITGSLFQSLDGVIQAPGGPEEDQTNFLQGGWAFPYFDDSLDGPMGRLFGSEYELLLGRRTYDIFAAYWPHNADQPIGAAFNALRKHVVTSSDRPLGWSNSHHLAGDPVAAVSLLTQGKYLPKTSRDPRRKLAAFRPHVFVRLPADEREASLGGLANGRPATPSLPSRRMEGR